jgi:hypothetical protein
MPRSPEERQLTAKLAAYESWAATPNRANRTAEARRKFDARFEDQVDPDRVLPEAERRQRADAARRAYYTRLALLSVKARRQNEERRARALAASRSRARVQPRGANGKFLPAEPNAEVVDGTA